MEAQGLEMGSTLGAGAIKACRRVNRCQNLGAQEQAPSCLCKTEHFKESCVVSWKQENTCPLARGGLSQSVGLPLEAHNTSYSHEWLLYFKNPFAIFIPFWLSALLSDRNVGQLYFYFMDESIEGQRIIKGGQERGNFINV